MTSSVFRRFTAPASLRVLLRNKRFATLAIVSLGVGIALNTTMYSVLDAFMNPRLDLPHPDRLHEIRFFGDYRAMIPVHERNAAYEELSFLEGITSARPAWRDRIAERDDDVREVGVKTVAANYFEIIGSRPQAGRLLTAADLDGSPRPVVLSERLWKQLFPEQTSFEPGVLIIGNQPRMAVGILAANADLPGGTTDVWQLPTPDELPMPNHIARFRHGVTAQQARAELSGLTARFATTTRERSRHVGFRVTSLVKFPFSANRFTWALIGSVAAVLLVACANLANLQLARGVARARELATRAAVGASRGQIVRQLVNESAWLAAGGLVLGGLLTWWGMHLVEAFTPPVYGVYEIKTQVSWRVMLFAASITLLCLGLVGLAPALRLSRVNLNEVLKSGAGTGRSRSIRRQYGVLVVVEVALALALLSSAGLLMLMAAEVRSVELPYDTRGLLSMIVSVPPDARVPRSRRDWSERLVQEARAVPGVVQAATLTWGGTATHAVSADDDGGAFVTIPAPQWGYSVVSPDYFRTLNLRIVEGRGFSSGEFAEPRVVVDQTTANCLWPGSDPVARLIKLDSVGARGPWLRVVGVAANLRSWDLQYNERTIISTACPTPKRLGSVFVLNAADTTRLVAAGTPDRRQPERISLLLRTDARNPMRTGARARRALLALDGVASVSHPSPLADAERLLSLQRRQNFVATLFTVFALFGGALAAIGVYAIISFSVAQRTREFGVRIAVGAGARQIRELVMRDGTLLALVGILGGVLITWQSAGLLRAFLFSDWDQYDSRVFAAAAILLFATAWLASWIPARRATRINPVEALRND